MPTKKKVHEATIEELIADVSNSEDPDQILQIVHDGKGMITVADPVWTITGRARTLRTALIVYGLNHWGNDIEYSNLDWS